MPRLFWFSLLLTFLFSVPVQAQEWTRFRGPNGTGESELSGLPAKWSESDYQWKLKLPGIGHSSPVVWGDKIFVLTADPDNATRYVLCVSAGDGKILWSKEYKSTKHHLHQRSSFASSTPAVDAERVYVAWSAPEATTLMAFSHEGKELWSTDLGTWISQHGFGTSPMLYKGKIYLNCSQEPSKLPDVPPPQHSFFAAVDQTTGSIQWKVPREIHTASYSVPFLYEPQGGKPQIVCCTTAEGMFSLDPESGSENWARKVFDKRTVSSPFLAGGMIIGTTGSGGGGNYVVALRAGSDPQIAYQVAKEAAPYVPAPVCRGNLMFLWSDKGIVTCVGLTDGVQHWQKRIGGNFSGSPVRAADKLYCIDDEGVVVVLAADSKFAELGRNPLGEASRSVPAIANGRIIFRTYSHLYSLGAKKS